MTTYIEFIVLKQLNNDFLKNIKIISVFGHEVSEVLIVTKDDKVFGFGQNDWGVLGFGHNRQVFEPKIVEELTGKGIIGFVNGLYHVIGLTNDGKIYSWGQNNYSQLGNGKRNNDFNKPEINEYLINEVIVYISCGGLHTIVISEKNELYVWGYNDSGQIGNNSEELFQLTPFKLKPIDSEIYVAISCSYWHSLALTDKGHVFSWGGNESGQLGVEENDGTYNMFKTKALKINKPTKVNLKIDNKTNVFIEKICCGCYHSMLLSSDGTIYTFGYNGSGQIGYNSVVNQLTHQKIDSSIKYKDIASHFHYNISIAVSIDNTFYIWGKLGEKVIKSPEESQLKSINDIFLTFKQITYKSNHILFDFETIINSCSDYKKNVTKERNPILETIMNILIRIRKMTENIDNEIIRMKDHLSYSSLLFSPNIIAKYRKMTQIKAKFNENMKTSFHFYDLDFEWPYTVIGRNALFVTEDSKIYSVESNSIGLIGFNHKNTINDPMIVSELSAKGIINFTNGYNHVIARTDKNQLYIWGYNGVGQLGNETYKSCFVPQLVEKLSEKCIVDVCCGQWHSLALTESGEVYSWGWNKFGQIGTESCNTFQLTPIKIKKFDDIKIIAISCGQTHSMALTQSGHVYSWGDNEFGQLGFTNIFGSNKPKLVKIKNTNKIKLKIQKICCGFEYSLLLTNDGDIYGFGSNNYGQLANKCFKRHFIPNKVLNEKKFIEIAAHYDCYLSAALTIDGIYYIWGYCGQKMITKPKATQFDSFKNIFLNYFQISYNRTQTNIKYETDLSLKTKQNINYNRDFHQYAIIGSGSFGVVSKVKNINENEICAIKRIAFNVELKDSLLKEFEILYQLNCDFVVKVKNYWIEDNYLLKNDYIYHASIKDPKNNLLLHIQMELCYKSLKEIIEIIKTELNLKYKEMMTQIHYYISSELLIEIVECVHYIHKQKPYPIIHRDLKPANILITHGIHGRFVKLCDFGLAKLNQFDGQSHTRDVETLKYMAPEFGTFSHKFNTKIDVYSLAIVIKDLFEDFKKQIEAKPETTFSRNYKNLSVLVEDMMKDQELRPECGSILNQKNSWALSISDVGNDTHLEGISNNSFSIEDNFHSFFIKKKLEILKQLQSETSARNSSI